MHSARPLLRLLAAILRVVALVVLVPVLAQAHAAHDHAGHDHAGLAQAGPVAGIAGAHRAEAAGRAPASIATTTDAADRSDCLGCRTCCCGHAFVATADPDAVRGDRLNGRRVAMGADIAHPGVVPEALPKPPRPFA